MARILVIDDDSSVRTAITTLLEHEGYEVVAAEDGRTGIDIFESATFDLLIVDIFMPGMDSFSSAGHRRCRSSPCRASRSATPRCRPRIFLRWPPSSAPLTACTSRSGRAI